MVNAALPSKSQSQKCMLYLTYSFFYIHFKNVHWGRAKKNKIRQQQQSNKKKDKKEEKYIFEDNIFINKIHPPLTRSLHWLY